VYFTGPFLCQTFSRVLNVKIDQAQLVEGVIGEHLRRSLVHFHAGKRELDFVVGEAGVELKWQEHASPGDFPRRSCSPSTT
jgi:predicted AAA+ superfamily ATPase